MTMTLLTDWRRKAVLLIASEKKSGASKIVSNYTNKSYAIMKHNKISEDDVYFDSDHHKPRLKDLSAHLNKVKSEFMDQPEICFYHATLVILLRRGYKTSETFEAFKNLWESENDFLLNNLSIRWIVSACDTFVDHSSCPVRSAILLNVATLVNTLKIYETEKLLRGFEDDTTTNQNNISALYSKHLILYQGLTYFRIGTDDTLKNMRSRYADFKNLDQLAGSILLFVFDELQNLDTAFSLVKSLHTDKKSKWWS